MTPEQWQEVERLLEEAIRTPRGERASFLQSIDDANLRAEVASLLAEHESDPSFLEEPLLRTDDIERVGAYRLVRSLGRGGMGQVYLAVRDDEAFTQYAALKVIRRGLDTDDILSRFRAERQILASLNHPNIARIFDGGATDDGRPYFVMEYVDGVPITEYCDGHRLSIDERLRLFLRVCSAVHHAHQNLIVHRDLKPSNILVTADGTPKLLDFGIAKMLDPRHAAAPVTRTELRRMTPEYASPEQVAGGQITTASDVYALGVLLYELLTGHRPYRLTRRIRHEIERIIQEELPTRPSTVIAEPVELRRSDGTGQTLTPDAVCEARSTRIDRLRKRLSGDLDNVILMALRKDPSRRYGTAEQFSEDIRRHLDGLPVGARPDTLSYRMQKFVRRHRFGVAAAAFIALLLVGSTTGMAVQSARIQAQSVQVEKERDRAELVANFLKGLFKTNDPNESKGETITARELLDRGAERLESELQDEPEMLADLSAVVAQVYETLGLYEPAEAMSRRVLAIRRDLYGDEHPDVGMALTNLGTVLYHMGRYDEAESLHVGAIRLRRNLKPPADTSYANALLNLALVLSEKRQFDEAASLYEEALQVYTRSLGERHKRVASTLNNLGSTLNSRGDFDGAKAALERSLDIRRSYYDEGHLSLATTANNLAALYSQTGDYRSAAPLLREVLQSFKTRLGEDHPNVATVSSNLASVLAEIAEYGESEALHREALRIQRETLGDDHIHVARSLNNLGAMLRKSGRYEESEMALREAISIVSKRLGPDNLLAASFYNNLAGALHRKGNIDEAQSLYERALSIFRNALGAEHAYVGAVLLGLADLQSDSNDPAAESMYRDALRLLEGGFPAGHPRIAAAGLSLGRHLMRNGTALAEADSLLRMAVDTRRSLFGEDVWLTADAEAALGACLAHQGRFAESEQLLLRAHDILQRERGSSSREVASTRSYLVHMYESSGRPALADPFR